MPHQTEYLPLTVNRCGYGRRVTGLFVCTSPHHFGFARPASHRHAVPVCFADVFPDRFARTRVKRDHPGVWLAADHGYQGAAFQNGRTANAEKGGRHLPILRRVTLPNQFPSLEREADQFPFGAECVAPLRSEQRSATGTVVVAVRVSELARITVTPKRFASPSVQAFDDFLLTDAVMQHEPVAAHRRRAVARADLFLPRDGDAVGGPAVEQAGFIGSPVAVRAEKLRPVLVWLVRAPTAVHAQKRTAGGGGEFS